MTDASSWLIGTSEECDLTVTATIVSGEHCRLTRTVEGYVVEDLDSTNGTYVNGVQITGPTPVSCDDQVTLGQSVAMPWPIEETCGDAVPRVIRVGRDPENDVVIDATMLSSFHAKITVTGNAYVISDLKSTNGTAINTPDNFIREAHLSPDDIVYFGSHKVLASQLIGLSSEAVSPTANSSSEAESAISFSGQIKTFGRSPDCDQVLKFPMISWEHARMIRTGSSITLEDLDSMNGTFVNGRAIHRPTLVTSGDTISLGSFDFVLTPEGSLKKRDLRDNLTLEAREIAIDLPGVRLLDQISLTLNPSEFTGLMGPSGAGKTTLMKALNGYTPPSDGDVSLNGRDLYREFSQFRGQIGYVPQDDIIHSDLTVAQALYFTARLRLPPDFRDDEINERIKKVLADLRIEHTQDVLIGSPEKQGISGGQRKRVNLAMELLTDPSLLFLDEPTSGLSSEDALSVMRVLRGLADSGKTILVTIHQPSLEVFQLLDNLVVVSKDPGSTQPGRLVYYGPAYPDSVNFFNPDGVSGQAPGVSVGPDEVLRGLACDVTDSWVQRYSASSYCDKFISKRARTSVIIRKRSKQTGQDSQCRSVQWLPLFQRCLAIKLKDTTNTTVLIAQAPIIAILIAMVFGGESSTAMNTTNWHEVGGAASTTVFLLALAALWFGCSNSVREIVAEWSIYHRERMVNLRIVPYIGSKFAVLGSLCMVQCFILLLIVHWGNGLNGPWLGMLTLLVLVSLVGLSIGLLVSALARTSDVAVSWPTSTFMDPQ